MTRGFITIATGKEHYQKIAANLLISYRRFSDNPMPFAVICECINDYTRLFDDIIITEKSTHSFMDKFLLFELCPYDENIFIDADSICYGDLNLFWKLFENATDFSAFGVDSDINDRDSAWYYIEDTWKYKDLLTYKSRVHAGVMFIRKTNKIKKLYNDCIDIISNFDKLHFHTCPTSKDECVLGIAMPMNNMKSTKEDSRIFGCYHYLKNKKTDMFEPRLSYYHESVGFVKKGILFHYGTFYTFGPLYRFDTDCLNLLEKKNESNFSFLEKILYKYHLKYYSLKVKYEVVRFFKRVINKLLKQHKDI